MELHSWLAVAQQEALELCVRISSHPIEHNHPACDAAPASKLFKVTVV